MGCRRRGGVPRPLHKAVVLVSELGPAGFRRKCGEEREEHSWQRACVLPQAKPRVGDQRVVTGATSRRSVSRVSAYF